MRKKAISILTSSSDSFKVERDDLDILYVNSVTEKKKSSFLKHNIIRLLLNNHSPSEQMLDFLNLAIAVYTADQLISRSKHGYLGWNRMIEIYLPVQNIQLWKAQKEVFEEMLSFLSGDKWIIHLRSRTPFNLPSKKINHEIEQVTLFSGGLDSYIGAVDMLSNNIKVAFVGHHKSGGSSELPFQQQLLDGLGKVYPDGRVKQFLFHLQPEKVEKEGFLGENTQRARSILFIALGLSVANSYGNMINLAVPENGLISLNVPLTKSRIGSLSTRTTHPYFFSLLNKAIRGLEIQNKVFNPYCFFTKGEMLLNCMDQKLIKEKANMTISCSKPWYYRQYYGKNEAHCGYCTPCIIRRAAMAKIGIDDASKYIFDIIKRPPDMGSKQGLDYNAFKSALERQRKKKVSLLDIAISGPLPGDNQELEKLKMVYLKGMQEVKTFFQGQ